MFLLSKMFSKKRQSGDEVVVYYCDYIPNLAFSPLEALELKKALGAMEIDKASNIGRCPAFKSFYENTYAFLSPKNIKVWIDDNKTLNWLVEPSRIDAHLHNLCIIRSEKTFSINNLMSIFWCEEELVAEQIGTFSCGTELESKTQTYCGSFDISKWFRPMETAYLFLKNENSVSIKRGDPLYFVRFNTTKKVVLKQFRMTPKLSELFDTCVQFKSVDKSFHHKLSNYYDALFRRGYKKEITKAIKESLVET